MRQPRAWVNRDPRNKQRWRVQYEDPNNGYRRRTHGEGFTKKLDAQAWADRFKADAIHGTWIDPSRGRQLFSEVAGVWLDSAVFEKANTQAGYRRIIHGQRSLLNARFGSTPIGSITHYAVRQWVKDMAMVRQPSTVRNNFYVLRLVMAFAVTERFISRDPSTGVKLPKSSRPNNVEEARFPLTPMQIGRIIEAMPEPWDVYTRLVAATGLRPEEAVGLQVQDFDPEDFAIRVRRVYVKGRYEVPKTNLSRRTIRLDTATCERLVVYLADYQQRAAIWFAEHPDVEHPGQRLPLFVAVGGLGKGHYARNAKPDVERLDFSKPADHTAMVTRYWKAALASAGLPGSVRFYDLRHAHASLIAAQIGRPGALTLKECQERMGHSNMATFYDRYVKSPVDENDRQRNALDALYAAEGNVMPFRQAN